MDMTSNVPSKPLCRAYDEENAAQQFPTAAQWFLMSQHDDHLMEIKPLGSGLVWIVETWCTSSDIRQIDLDKVYSE